MRTLLLISLAGALGALTRYGLAGLVQRWTAGFFPWGTFAVNALGCFLFGVIYPLAEDRLLISPDTRKIILTGYMGALTTFSTYIFESEALLEESSWWLMLGNLLGQVVVGFLCLTFGLILGRLL